MRTRVWITVAIGVALVLPELAAASYLVTRNPGRPTLKVDAQGHALVSYVDRGVQKHVLVSDAINAAPPTRGQRQVEFKVDYSGGAKSLGKRDFARGFKNACGRYDGPALAWFVTACKAPDGSYWALQSWQRMLPNLGVPPWKPEQSVQELHVSHWRGPLPQIEVWLNWSWSGRFRQIVGRYTYAGQAVYGFSTTSFGAPLDSWGRNLYLDTFGSAYGAGWARENSLLAQQTNGRFCYSLGPRNPYPGYPNVGPRQGSGTRYRITALGPGVTPVVMWEGADPGAWDPSDPAKVKAEQDTNALIQSLGFSPKDCHT